MATISNESKQVTGKTFIGLATLAALSLPSAAIAQRATREEDTTEEDALGEERPQDDMEFPPLYMLHPQMPETHGMLLDLELSRDALRCLEVEPERLVQIRLIEQRLQLNGDRIRFLSSSLTSAEQDASAGQILLAVRSREVSQLKEGWRHPAIWFAVGLVLGVAGVAVAAAAF